jgi:hypothetical protein
MWDKYHPGYFGKVRSISVFPASVCALWGRPEAILTVLAPAAPIAPPRGRALVKPLQLPDACRWRSSQVGMRYFHKLKNKFHMPTINTDKLNTLISDEVRRSSPPRVSIFPNPPLQSPHRPAHRVVGRQTSPA